MRNIVFRSKVELSFAVQTKEDQILAVSATVLLLKML